MSATSRTDRDAPAPRRARVLFLCTGNSARSQIAEAWARALAGDVIEAHSAGTAPKGLDPRAVRTMAEAGIDISAGRSKSMDELQHLEFDLVVTVCDAAREACPTLPGGARHVHAGFDDPPHLAETAASEAEAMAHYSRVRDEIRGFVTGLRAGFLASGARG